MSRGNRIITQEAWGRARQSIALPVYTLALLLDYLSDALGRRGAWIAGDNWPE